MSNEQGIIEMGNRKRFGLIRFYDVKEIKEEPLMEIIHEAIMVDEEVWKKKISAGRIRYSEKIKRTARGIREK
jgi:preprotein translocase subunit Sec61beta